MEITLELCLPREAASVPVTRQMLDASLHVLGVEGPTRADIQVMLSEACTNVVRHAQDSDDFSVRAVITDDRCLIKVLDRGHGFDAEEERAPDSTSESGRGVLIMRALADDVRFSASQDNGTLVTLEKHLFYGEDSAGDFLTHHTASAGLTHRQGPAHGTTAPDGSSGSAPSGFPTPGPGHGGPSLGGPILSLPGAEPHKGDAHEAAGDAHGTQGDAEGGGTPGNGTARRGAARGESAPARSSGPGR